MGSVVALRLLCHIHAWERGIVTAVLPGPLPPGPLPRDPVPASGLPTVPAPAAHNTPKVRLRGEAEIRHFFRTNQTPVYVIGATPFNLLGLDRWVRNFHYITYYDGWDGQHPLVFSPAVKPYVEFTSGEDINNYLLLDPEVRAFMDRPGHRPKVVMVFFDAETERICAELGYDLILPSAELREYLDSKIVTTRLGNEAGSPSVPNILTAVDSWGSLVLAATGASLGTDLVIQTAYGDSGKTTFFVSSEAEWDECAEQVVAEPVVKVMKRINHRAIAMEAVLTRHGTLVGASMLELTGHPELTPYQGGWCGDEMFPDVLSPERRRKATALVRKLGDRLSSENCRGFFEVDILVDLEADEVYLGELNPRISGATVITDVTAGAYADLPLFLFHLLEYMDVEYDLDVDAINVRWEALAAADVWSHLIIKEISPTTELIDTAPATGQWYFDKDQALVFKRAALDWTQLQDDTECFFLRVYGPGDYRWHGSDLGIIVTQGRLQEEEPGADGGPSRLRLTERAIRLIDAVRSRYHGIAVTDHKSPPSLTSFK